MSFSIGIVIPYFGNWPVWMNFFVESCRTNHGIDWIIFGDADPPENRSPNVRHVNVSFDAYQELLSDTLKTRVRLDDPYKLCDFKPALPYVHREQTAGYDFVGFGDLDVIYGHIRGFYNDELLSDFDMLSSHGDRVSGHLFLMRNSEENITVFQRAPGWKEMLSRKEYVSFDEYRLFNFLRGSRAKLLAKLGFSRPRCFFRETYSTPAATNRMRWYWENGELTNEFYPHHPFMYLHFMSWHSSRWLAYQGQVAPGAPAPWARLPTVVQMDWRRARDHGFMISPAGIQSIERSRYA